MKRLLLYGHDLERAWKLLYEYATLYGDNGGEPDGNTWLPSNQDQIPGDLQQSVVQAGLGRLVEVHHGNDEAMVNYLAQIDPNAVLSLRVKLANDEFDHDDAHRLREAASNAGLRWAHYGSYGVSDSYWIFVRESS